MKQMRRFLRKWLVRAALNVALVTGLFFAAQALERAVAPWWPEIPHWPVVTAIVIWAAAALLAVPPLLSGANKLKAAAILFAETGIPATTPRQTWVVRATVAGVLLLLGTEALALWLLWLFTAFDFPWPAFVALLILFTLVMVHVWRAFVHFYTGLRSAATPSAAAVSRGAALARLIRNWPVADLDLVTITGSVAKKPIRARELHNRTGARVAGIFRDHRNIANPSPNVELHAGDQVLVAGSASQLAAARLFLTEGRLPVPTGVTAAAESSPTRPHS